MRNNVKQLRGDLDHLKEQNKILEAKLREAQRIESEQRAEKEAKAVEAKHREESLREELDNTQDDIDDSLLQTAPVDEKSTSPVDAANIPKMQRALATLRAKVKQMSADLNRVQEEKSILEAKQQAADRDETEKLAEAGAVISESREREVNLQKELEKVQNELDEALLGGTRPDQATQKLQKSNAALREELNQLKQDLVKTQGERNDLNSKRREAKRCEAERTAILGAQMNEA
jgi:DNA repair exonuclease SbcCD ATPase subunit